MKKTLIKNASIINEGRTFYGSVLIEGMFISAIYDSILPENIEQEVDKIIDATGKLLLPGMIDDQVHFREPGLTHKGTINSESRAAAAGGITTFMDMPNTQPQTVTIDDLEWKFQKGADCSIVNYSFFFGGTNENISEIKKLDKRRIPGLKLFLGSSTGNMLIDKKNVLEQIFNETNILIAVHAEKEEIIKNNIKYYTSLYGDDLDVSFHSKIRSAESCYASSSEAIELANRCNTRLHLLHLSTAKEMTLLNGTVPLKDKRITGEVCVHHLWFDDSDYARLGNRIKWNPAIKTREDRDALRDALNKNMLDIVATDHAPHLLAEKEGSCLKAASGGPLVQHALILLLELARQGVFTLEKIVEKTAHNPAELYSIEKRGFIRSGYYADLVLVNPNENWIVSSDTLLYKCGWSPLEGYEFNNRIWKTFVNGEEVFGDGKVNDSFRGMEVRYLH